MRWLLLALSCVAAQPTLPLLPSGVTIDMVKQIDVTTPGSVQFVVSTDGSSSISSRLAATPVVHFDNSTGILSVTVGSLSGSSLLRPGLIAAFLALALGATTSKHHVLFMLLSVSLLGVASAGVVAADVTIRIPGCFHTEGADGKTLVFDTECLGANTTAYAAVAAPLPTVQSSDQWTPITPSTSFLPANDHGMHYLDPATQYEVWRSQYGKAYDPDGLINFLDFTERCRIQNQDPDRSWTAACNQFSDWGKQKWRDTILANNSQLIAEGGARRRLLEHEMLYSDVADTQRRKLLAPTSFSWVGTGKLTPVKDQGQCGSCYAHSTSSQMEAQLAITQGSVPVALSREQLKDCSPGAPGCNGGSPSQMFTFAAGAQGLTTEANYPYVASNAACKTSQTVAYKDTGYVAIANNEAAFTLALQTGPVAVTVCADTWDNYAGGVFRNCPTGCSVNHAVLLVGYGSDATLGDYWLIQNSWNTWWGESGFIRLPNTHSSTAGVGMCGLTTYPGYQAKTPSGSASGTGTPCQGSWSAWTACSKTCGGGTQTKTWTTTALPTGGGTPCPNPTTQSQSCNTAICPTPTPVPSPNAPTPSTGLLNCYHISNSVLGSNGDANYQKVANWQENWCGTDTLPQYQYTNQNGQVLLLFFYATNCVNGKKTAGLWGLGTTSHAGYQWANTQSIVNGVIPPPNTATGWTLQFSVCT